MGMNLVIAVTDGAWLKMLRRQPNLGEINFRAPHPANFHALKQGELFLSKLHAPRNVIVGGGIFAYANVLPCSRLGSVLTSEWRTVRAGNADTDRALS